MGKHFNNNSCFGTTMLSEKAKAFSIDSLLKTDTIRQQNTYPLSDREQTYLGLQDGCQRQGCGSACYHSSIQTQTDSRTGRQISAELCHDDLWQAFHALGTEMIITKTGRRMFPALRVKFGGLKTEASYRISLHFVPIDQNKYRYVYHSSKWMVAGPGDLMISGQVYEHSDSPVEGIHLPNQVLSFERIKLTNSNCPKDGQISLVSMQKFQPRIHIREVLSTNGGENSVSSSSCITDEMVFSFPQTSFMAVTAYQNQEITRLKIARNPFAKGFREAGKTRSSLDTIMASFGYNLSPRVSKLNLDRLQRTKHETEDICHARERHRLVQTITLGHAPDGTFHDNRVTLSSGINNTSFGPPPAHIPDLYSLEMCSFDHESLKSRLFAVQQHEPRSKFLLDNYMSLVKSSMAAQLHYDCNDVFEHRLRLSERMSNVSSCHCSEDSVDMNNRIVDDQIDKQTRT